MDREEGFAEAVDAARLMVDWEELLVARAAIAQEVWDLTAQLLEALPLAMSEFGVARQRLLSIRAYAGPAVNRGGSV